METLRRQLLELLREKSFRYSPDKPFKLVSGRESPYYIDCRPTTHNAQGLALIGEIFFDLIRDLKVDAIGGLTMGADPIAHATALTSYFKGQPINAFSVRQRPKEHGTGGVLVGDVTPGTGRWWWKTWSPPAARRLRAVAAAREFGLDGGQGAHPGGPGGRRQGGGGPGGPRGRGGVHDFRFKIAGSDLQLIGIYREFMK